METELRHIVITGGSGFIGRHLAGALLERGHQVRILDPLAPQIAHPALRWVEGSVQEQDALHTALDGCDAVYHLASTTIPQSSNENPLFDVETNLGGTIRLLEACVAAQVKKLVFASSGGTVYGIPEHLPVTENSPTNPLCSYGIVKLAIEKYLLMFQQLYGLNGCILRISNPYGTHQRHDSGQGVIAAFCHKAARGEALEIWGDGNIIRDYIHIDDVTDAFMRCMRFDCKGQILNIGSGQGTSLNDIIGHIETTLAKPVQRHYQASRPFDVPAVYLCTDRARQLLHWQPRVSLQEGIDTLIQSLQEGPP